MKASTASITPAGAPERFGVLARRIAPDGRRAGA